MNKSASCCTGRKDQKSMNSGKTVTFKNTVTHQVCKFLSIAKKRMDASSGSVS